jgi:hypothetical protein
MAPLPSHVWLVINNVVQGSQLQAKMLSSHKALSARPISGGTAGGLRYFRSSASRDVYGREDIGCYGGCSGLGTSARVMV